MTLYRFTLTRRPDIFLERESDDYAKPTFETARAELSELAGHPVSFADVRTTRPRELVPVRLVGAERNAGAR